MKNGDLFRCVGWTSRAEYIGIIKVYGRGVGLKKMRVGAGGNIHPSLLSNLNEQNYRLTVIERPSE